MHACGRPHAFKAVFTVSLHGEKLRTDLRVINTGDAAFEFTAALHSYFEVLDIAKAKVNGLAGLKYLDKVSSFQAGVIWNYVLGFSVQTLKFAGLIDLDKVGQSPTGEVQG